MIDNKTITKKIYKYFFKLIKKDSFLEKPFSMSILGYGEYFDEYIDLIEGHFVMMGIKVFRNKKNDIDIFLIINPLFQKHKLNFNRRKSVYACIQTEQINSHSDKGFIFLNSRMTNKKVIKILKKYDLVFEWSKSNYNYLNRYIHSVRYLPYSNISQASDTNFENKEEYDLVFIGSETGVDNRRRVILDRLKKEFKVYPKHEGLWGNEKVNAIQSSKICLNIHFDYSMAYESNRFLDYFSFKKLVLSEYIFDSYPFKDGEHYVSFNNIDDLLVLTRYYITNIVERQLIADRAFNLATLNHFTKSFDLLFNTLRVELEDKQVNKKLFIVFKKINDFISFFSKILKKINIIFHPNHN